MGNGKTDKQSSALTVFFFCIVMVFFMALEYLFVNGFVNEYTNMFTKATWTMTMRNGDGLYVGNRIIYTFLLLMGFHLANQKRKGEDPKKYRIYIIPVLITYIPIVIGYLHNKPTYNILLLPILLLVNTVFVALFSRSFLKEQAIGDDPLNDVSCLPENDMSIEFDVILPNGLIKTLRIHSPQQGLYIQGGAGSGKSASIFEPALYQYTMKGFGGYVYDFKGSESPLSRAVFNTLHFKKDEIIKRGYKVPKFHYINILEPFKSTGKLNPINPRYIKRKLYADAAAEVLFKNLDKSAIKKTDFWTSNGINYTAACIWRLVRLAQTDPNYSHVSTIPHLVTLMLRPITEVVEFLLQDPEIGPTVASIKSAYENEAGSQLSGVEASSQIPLGKLYNKDIFWFFNPSSENEEIDLKINDPNDPTFLCLCNHESLKEALSPLIGVTTSTIINVLNDSTSFYKTIFGVDELPTQFIKDLDFVPATMRSKKVVTMVGVQEYSQLERDYSREQAKVIVGNLGNQFYGMTNDSENAEKIAKMFGEYDKASESNTTSDSGSSVSESTKKEKVRQGKDIMGQPIGHFSGKIAGGDPAFFSCQFPDGRIHKKLGIEESELIQIPYSNFPVDDNFSDFSKKLKFQTAIYNELIDENFQNIIQDIDSILEPIKAMKAAKAIK